MVKSYHQSFGNSISRCQKGWGGPKPIAQKNNTGVWEACRRNHAFQDKYWWRIYQIKVW